MLVGGDGTVHAAANSGVPLPELALIPAGRANNIARALGVPAALHQAAALAAAGSAVPIDLLHVEHRDGARLCVEALSAGLQADARMRYRGQSSGDLRQGAGALLGSLRRFRPYELRLELDGARAFQGQAAQVFLANLPYFGFGFRVDPDADPRDGLIEAIVVRAGSRLSVARLLAAAYRGRHLRSSAVTAARAREARLEGSLPLACDGTPLGVGDARARVEPGRLTIVSPWPP